MSVNTLEPGAAVTTISVGVIAINANKLHIVSFHHWKWSMSKECLCNQCGLEFPYGELVFDTPAGSCPECSSDAWLLALEPCEGCSGLISVDVGGLCRVCEDQLVENPELVPVGVI